MFVPTRIAFRHFSWPTATAALICCNVLGHIGQQFLSPEFQHQLCLRTDVVDPVGWVTSMFMHADWRHLILNMVFMWPFAVYLESRLGWLGTLLLYFIGGLGAAGVFYFAHQNEQAATLGASGAISGMMGVCVVAAPLARLHVLPTNPVHLAVAYIKQGRFSLHVPLLAWVILFAGTQGLLLSVGIEGVAYEAHLGGLVSGVLVGFGMRLGILPGDLSGPGTAEDLRKENREQLLYTALAAWEKKTETARPPVDYLAARKPNWNEGKKGGPPASILDLDEPE